MPEPDRIIDPEYDDLDHQSIKELGERPAAWQDTPPWAEARGPIRLRGTAHNRLRPMVKGHIKCADALVRDIPTRDGDEGYLMALPAMGWARHAMELALKDILLRAKALEFDIGGTSTNNLRGTHNLQALADATTALLQGRDDARGFLPKWGVLYDHLRWWQAHDPKNFWGRYGLDKNGRTMEDHGVVDVTQPLLIARATFSVWYSLDAWLDAMEEYRAEYESEMRAEYEDAMRDAYGDY